MEKISFLTDNSIYIIRYRKKNEKDKEQIIRRRTPSIRCTRRTPRGHHDYRWRIGHQVLQEHRMPQLQVLWQIPMVACKWITYHQLLLRTQRAVPPSGIADNMVMKDCTIDGPKFFREMRNLELENVSINDADETFWKVDGLKLKNVKLHDGTYPFMFSKNIFVDGLGKRLQICIPILPQRRDTPRTYHNQGQFLGMRECDSL